MTTHTIDALRESLFETLQALRCKENPMDIERAKAITDVAQVIINTAKVEVEHMKVAGGTGTGFIPSMPKTIQAAPVIPQPIGSQQPASITTPTHAGSKTVTNVPGGQIIQHKMR